MILGFTLVAMMSCTIVGVLVPAALKQRRIETTQYYEVMNVQIDKQEYVPCEGMLVTVQRNALQDLLLKSTRELTLVKTESFEEVYQEQKVSVAEAGQFKIEAVYTLPCTKADGRPLEEGTYFWQVDIEYEVEGESKNENIRTPYFAITAE